MTKRTPGFILAYSTTASESLAVYSAERSREEKPMSTSPGLRASVFLHPENAVIRATREQAASKAPATGRGVRRMKED